MNILLDKRLGMLRTSAVAAACLTLMSFLVACGGGAGSVNNTGWNAITPPKLTGISPATGPTTGDTTVAITGTDIQKGASVLFGNVPAAKINSVTSTSIEAVTPVHDPGKVDVKVTNPDTRSDTLLGAFTFEGSPLPIGGPAPTVNSVLPNSGPVIGGTVVTITGTDFQSGATVTFGQSPAAAVVFSSATQLLATTPAHAQGTVDVIVRNPDTQSAMVSGGFTYQPVPAPTIISLLPTSGPEAGGTLVTVWGTNFLAGATVSFGGVAAASVTVTSATQLGAVTPPHATGVVDVRVTNPDSQFATLVGAFTYATPPPTITAVSPASGTIAGGTSVTITGTGFQPGVPGTTVTFGAVAGTGVNVLSYTKIQVTTPAHAAGAVDVRVTNPDGQFATLAGGYAYVTSPVIAGLSVDSGLSIGGTPVTITGSNFAGGATVTFGTLPAASVNVVSTTQIDVTTPAQPVGTIVDVKVTNPDTKQGTLPNAFRYGQILISDGFESGTYSAWNYQNTANATINGNLSFVHSSIYSSQLYFHRCGKPSVAPSTGQTTGGDQPGTYYVKYTYADGTHETIASSEASQVVTASHLLTVAGPSKMVDITGWNVYVSTSAGTETLQNVTPIDCSSGTCANWTMPGSGLVAGAALPGSTTGCGNSSQDNNEWFKYKFTLHGYPSGASHFFVRGYVYFSSPTDPLATLGMQRKLYYNHGGASGTEWNSVIITDWNLTDVKYHRMRVHTNDLGTAPDGIGAVDCYGSATATTCGYTPPFTCANSFGNGSCWSNAARAVDVNLNRDIWYSIEMENQSNTSGNSDGIIRVWVDDILWFEATNMHMRSSGTTNGVYSIGIGNQTERGNFTPVNEYRYWDDVVIGDAYIGPQVPPP